MRRDKPIIIAVSTPNGRITCITQTCGVLSYYVQHRLNVGRRASDNTQDFACRRLLFQRLIEFLEQSYILDGDDSLVSKSFKQFDLRRGEGAHLSATSD